MSTALSRLEREGLRAALRRECPPHPTTGPRAPFWQRGDAMTPDKLVCGRCFAVLARRRHTVENPLR